MLSEIYLRPFAFALHAETIFAHTFIIIELIVAKTIEILHALQTRHVGFVTTGDLLVPGKITIDLDVRAWVSVEPYLNFFNVLAPKGNKIPKYLINIKNRLMIS